MIIKERQFEKCSKCNITKSISEEIYGCDCCHKKMNMTANGIDFLEMCVFYHSREKVDHLHFCSWNCIFETLPKLKTDYFISLPYLQFDSDVKESCSANAFFKELNLRKKKK